MGLFAHVGIRIPTGDGPRRSEPAQACLGYRACSQPEEHTRGRSRAQDTKDHVPDKLKFFFLF